VAASSRGRLLAVSDLHVSHRENREVLDLVRPASPDDWLIVAGDIATHAGEVLAVLARVKERFDAVIWTPGNHELWTHPSDPLRSRGEERYRYLVDGCRRVGVLTPEDAFPVWDGPGGPARIAPLFVLYDYSFLADGVSSLEQSLARAHQAGVVCVDEYLLHPDPYPDRQSWCHARVATTEDRLSACDTTIPLVLATHWPLIREPTQALFYQDFAQWCGTILTAGWHRRYHTAAAVYGHLHIPRTTVHDGVPFHEVSLGYPREWARRPGPPPIPRVILPRTEIG
jgi:3',5'-cyclic AMP phosphodiesterase CpdA